MTTENQAADQTSTAFTHTPSSEPASAPTAGEPGAESSHMDFNTFIISLGTSALFHLGVSLPSGEPGEVNLPLAQNAIDTLAMLEVKTKGNLNHDEGLLLGTLLYDLRMRFIQTVREHPAAAGSQNG